MSNSPRSLFVADAEFLSRDQAKALCDRVLSFARADETRVNVASGWTGNSRFAGNEITTSGGTTDTNVTVTSTVGKRRASASTNILDDESLKRTVAFAESLARLSPEDPEIMPELGPQSYATINAYFDSTANLTPEARAVAAKKTITAAETAGGGPAANTFAAGFLVANAGAQAIATSRGLFAYHRSSDADLSITARTPDGTGSGWASAGARDWSLIDPASLGRTAASKAVRSRNPKAVEPGLYTVVLEPHAVAEIMPQLAAAFNARTNDEGRGTFSKPGGGTKLGDKIADERVTIYSDPTDPDLLAAPFANDGTPLSRVVYIEKGILKNFSYDRYWAAKQGKTPTTGGGGGRGGGGGGGGGGGAGGGGLKFVGGTKTTEQLIAETKRGILVTHFFYIRFLDQRTVLLTGLTRDGTFLIENGKVVQPVKNFRWNESPLFLLSKIEEIGKAERTAAGQVMPALRCRDFNFSSLSDAV